MYTWVIHFKKLLALKNLHELYNLHWTVFLIMAWRTFPLTIKINASTLTWKTSTLYCPKRFSFIAQFILCDWTANISKPFNFTLYGSVDSRPTSTGSQIKPRRHLSRKNQFFPVYLRLMLIVSSSSDQTRPMTSILKRSFYDPLLTCTKHLLCVLVLHCWLLKNSFSLHTSWPQKILYSTVSRATKIIGDYGTYGANYE